MPRSRQVDCASPASRSGHPTWSWSASGRRSGSDGRSDLSQLRTALHGLHDVLASDAPLVVRSTLPPGATRLAVEWADIPTARVLTNPEFLRQGTALEDFLNPTRIVVGHFPDATPATIERLVSVYDDLDAPVLVMDVAAAEIAKNGANAFLALKLSFANEIASVAEEFGTDVDAVLEGIALDPADRRAVHASGPRVRWQLSAQGAPGAGGVRHESRAADARDQRRVGGERRPAGPVRRSHRGARGGPCRARPSASSGVAFKAHTDDVRDSPPLAVARGLLERGAPWSPTTRRRGANARRDVPELRFVDDPALALDGADIGVIGTEWPIYRDLDWAAIRTTMRSPTIIDGRRLLDGDAPAAARVSLRGGRFGFAA